MSSKIMLVIFLSLIGFSIALEEPIAVTWEGHFTTLRSISHVNREICNRLAIEHPNIELLLRLSEADKHPDESLVSIGEGSKYHLLNPRLSSRSRSPLHNSKHAHEYILPPLRVTVRHQWPLNESAANEGEYWVVMQPWESVSAPVQWVKLMNNAIDDVWTYSSSNRNAYLRSGVHPDRVHAIILGVDEQVFTPVSPPNIVTTVQIPSQKAFRFLYVGGTIGRKGFDILLRAFEAEFTRQDDVVLIVKDMGAESYYKHMNGVHLIDQMNARNPDAPEVLYDSGSLSELSLAELYRSCHALVAPFRAEGFALPVAEAMASGLPVIVTNGGGVTDYVSAETAYLIDAEEIIMRNDTIWLGYETMGPAIFLQPSESHLRQLMRHVVNYPEEARAVGMQASERIRTHFTWKHTAQRVVNRLIEITRTPIRRTETGQHENASHAQHDEL